MYLTWKLNIPLILNIAIPLYTEFGGLVATSYNRVVVGDRGPYVEFEGLNIRTETPEGEGWRYHSDVAYYIHLRALGRAPIKIYRQLRTVAYADYKVGLYYISPFDLHYDSKTGIKPVISYQQNFAGQASLL
jgi:hypothetical protein